MARKPGTGLRSIKMDLIPSKSRPPGDVLEAVSGSLISQKAHKLVSLCGRQFILLVPSPSGKTVYKVGSPGVTQVLKRFESLSSQAGGTAILNAEIETALELKI